MSKRKIEFLNRILSVILYLSLTISIAYCSTHFTTLMVLGSALEIGRLLSLLTVIQILVMIFLTIYGGRSGYRLAALLLILHMLFVSMGIIRSRNLGSIPGVFMNIEGLLIISIIHSYINRMHRIANTDVLTNLSNRRGLVEHVERLVQQKKRFAFVLVDLDDFKTVNDLMGHDHGDLLLHKFAEKWLKKTKQEHAFFARIGGDEFVIVQETGLSKKEFRQYFKAQILQNQPNEHTYALGNEDVRMTASIGVSFYPEDAQNYTDLYRYADVAMYHVKNKEKQNVEIFESVLINTVSGDYILEQNVRSAIQNNQLYVVYQPQFHTQTETLLGVEALVRMRDAEGNTISPYHFIPIAEKSRMILDIDFFVLHRALQEFKALTDEHPELLLSVNFSVKTIFSSQFILKIREFLDETGFPPQNLQIEVTESVLISSHGKETIIRILEHIHELGIRIAVDDFGTGYSSLSYLMDLPIDTLKIDKSFIDRMSENEEQHAFVNAIISLGHILHMKVVAEGIETQSQLEILKHYHCDCIQGYLLGKPMELTSLRSQLPNSSARHREEKINFMKRI